MKAKAKKIRSGSKRKPVSKEHSRPSPNGASAAGLRSVEDEWLPKHPEKLRAHAGEYVVVEGRRIVAHSADAKAAVETAKRRGVTVP